MGATVLLVPLAANVALGVGAYFITGMESFTALIPAVFGILGNDGYQAIFIPLDFIQPGVRHLH